MAFDVSAVQADSQHMEMQDQSAMMPPNMGKLPGNCASSKFNANILGQDENDSQQAAEAMIQLGYYSNSQTQQDESLDFDPNYDPSDFLLKKDPAAQPDLGNVQPESQYQEPYEYQTGMIDNTAGGEMEMQQQPSFYGSFSDQPYTDFGFQQPQQMPQEDYSQPQVQLQPPPNDGGGLADLEISDSDDEDDQNEEVAATQNQADTSKDDDGLWF